MSRKPVAAIILAAGQGTRMNSGHPKVLHEVAGQAILQHVLDAVSGARIRKVAVVIGPDGLSRGVSLDGRIAVFQKDRLGTAHAVMQARRLFRTWKGDLLVLPGDAPCIQAETLRKLIELHQRQCYDATLLTA